MMRRKEIERLSSRSVLTGWTKKDCWILQYSGSEIQLDTAFEVILNARVNFDKPHFVILDEMNLAKVEYYFSDFLSIMESRTQDNPDGEAIHLHSLAEAKTPDGRDIPNKVQIPRNVFFTGTVNVDETTYMFSPKVLDRSNVIEFNDVNLDGYSAGASDDDSFYLKNPDVRNGLIDPETLPFCSRKDYAEFEEIFKEGTNPIEEILNLLNKYNLHFGYRAVNEISRFLWLSSNFLNEECDLQQAMDIQILQKILPKFHGTRGKLEDPLKDLHKFCNAEHSESGVLYPRSAIKIARMLKNLEIQGYTSFIE